MYQIYIRDRNLQRIGVIGDYRKFSYTLSFNDVGKWTLELADGTREAEYLKKVREQGGGLSGILVERENQFLFSGPIRNLEITGDWDDTEGDLLRVEGTDDNGFLATRLAMPPPYYAVAGTGIGYDVFQGNAEAAMIHLVRKNGGEESANPRRILGLVTPTNGNRGSNVTVRSRYHPLLEKLQECALPDELGFHVIQVGQELQFQVYEPQDKSRIVVFSRERRNLAGYRYSVEAPQSNFVIGGGTGEEEARVFAYLGDEPSRALYGTIETFDDQRNISDQAELIKSINNKMIEQTEKTELEIQPLNVEPNLFMRDYTLGDRVSVEIQGEVIQDLIRSISVEVTEDVEKVTPVVGTPGVGTRFRLFDQVRNLEGRLGQIERR